MAFLPLPLHLRRRRGRAIRLAVGGAALLLLAVAAAAALLPGVRMALTGGRPDRHRTAAGLAGDPGAPGDDGTRGSDDGRAGAEASGADGRPDGSSVGSGLADDRDGGDAGKPGARARTGAEQVLAFFDEVERQVDAAMARARESVVLLEYTAENASSRRQRIASGVVINARGDILSVRIDPPREEPVATASGSSDRGKKRRGATPIVARDYLGRRHVARWLAADPQTGLTLLRVSPRAVRPIRPAVDRPKLGSQVFVLGNPFGMANSVNRGHVAGLDRVMELGEQQLGGLIQVRAPVYPGDSGAAVVDVRGGWLGLIRSGLAIPGSGRPPAGGPEAGASGGAGDDGESDTDFGFAIPTRDALWIADQLRIHGRVDRSYLGVRLAKMRVSEGPIATGEPAASATEANPTGDWRGAGLAGAPVAADESHPAVEPELMPIPGDGARIVDVVDGTPAARAGLRVGDRIVAVDGQAIRSRNDLIDRLDRIPARTAIVLGVVREGESARRRRLELTVRTASRSGPGGAAPGPVPVAGAATATAAASRSTRPSVPVTPTASEVSPAPAPRPAAPPSEGARPAPPASPGPNPSPAGSHEARPSAAAAPASVPREVPPAASAGDESSAPTALAPSPAVAPAPAPDRAGPAMPAAGSFDELRRKLPRAVVEHIENLERRIDELEHPRTSPGASRPAGVDARTPAPPPAAVRPGERLGQASGTSGR